MLGAIIGDIVGSRYEFNPTNDYNFEMFAPGSDFTDDTVCTIAVADALLHSRDYGESIHEWCRKYPNPKGGYGGRFRQWVMSDEPKPYGSFGNGSAMRVSPIGWWYDMPQEIIMQAKRSAECTHSHEYGIDGAISVALAIADCLKMRRENSGKRITQKKIREQGLARAVVPYLNKTGRFYVNLESHRNKFDETCQGTVPMALWIVMHSSGFEDAIRRAVNLGADADTLGAIVGSIAEAIWGIPEWIKAKALTYLPADMKLVLKLFRQRLNKRRKELKAQRKEEAELDRLKAVMRWKLGLGNFNHLLEGRSPLPPKTKTATSQSWHIEPMPEGDDVSRCELKISIAPDAMEILRKGHIPEAQEDHWFMYADDTHIRYYRSWTGMPAFEAHYRKVRSGNYVIDSLTMNKGLAEFGVNGDMAGIALFQYLIAAEAGGDAEQAWNIYLQTWTELHHKHSKNKQQ